MPLRLAVNNARQLFNGVWVSDFRPEEVRILGRCQTSVGNRTVIGVRRPIYNEADGRLEIEPDACHVLNVGKTTETYFLDLGEEPATEAFAIVHDSGSESTPITKAGDRAFLDAIRCMPGQLRSVGEQLLGAIRRSYPSGELEPPQTGWRFVERPDNFWTIKPQFTDQSFAITLRGRPERFQSPKFVVKEDRKGYSWFKVEPDADVEEAIRIVLAANRRRI